MKKNIIIMVLLVSVSLNLFLGVKYRDTKNIAKENFYYSISIYYNVFKGLEYDLFTSKQATLNDADYVQKAIQTRTHTLFTIDHIIFNFNRLNNKENSYIEPMYLRSYLYSITDYVSKNGKLPEKEISNLKEIIKIGKRVGLHGEGAPDYHPEIDPILPRTRINNELKEIDKLSKEGLDRLENRK